MTTVLYQQQRHLCPIPITHLNLNNISVSDKSTYTPGHLFPLTRSGPVSNPSHCSLTNRKKFSSRILHLAWYTILVRLCNTTSCPTSYAVNTFPHSIHINDPSPSKVLNVPTSLSSQHDTTVNYETSISFQFHQQRHPNTAFSSFYFRTAETNRHRRAFRDKYPANTSKQSPWNTSPLLPYRSRALPIICLNIPQHSFDGYRKSTDLSLQHNPSTHTIFSPP